MFKNVNRADISRSDVMTRGEVAQVVKVMMDDASRPGDSARYRAKLLEMTWKDVVIDSCVAQIQGAK